MKNDSTTEKINYQIWYFWIVIQVTKEGSDLGIFLKLTQTMFYNAYMLMCKMNPSVGGPESYSLIYENDIFCKRHYE